MKKKSVVLSDIQQNSNQKAVLSLQEDGVGVYGTLRLYNFSHELSGISSLGFYANQKVYKAGLTYKSRMFYEFFIATKEIPDKFSCAVVNFQNAVATPILYGSSEGSDDDIYGSIITEIAKDNSVKHTESVLDDFGVDFDEAEQKTIEKEIDEAVCKSCENCADCVYKKYFYENHENEENHKQEKVLTQTNETKQTEKINKMQDVQMKTTKENDEILDYSSKNDENISQEKEEIFIDRLKPQIDKLFENYPVEDNLQKLIPSSKWIKVEYEDEGDFYVFGLLYDEDKNIKYVCYGVPAVFEEEAPKELSGYPIWLPLDKENVQGFGYWLTYQDATTGEPVRAIID
jgi:hypothetical protein